MSLLSSFLPLNVFSHWNEYNMMRCVCGADGGAEGSGDRGGVVRSCAAPGEAHAGVHHTPDEEDAAFSEHCF